MPSLQAVGLVKDSVIFSNVADLPKHLDNYQILLHFLQTVLLGNAISFSLQTDLVIKHIFSNYIISSYLQIYCILTVKSLETLDCIHILDINSLSYVFNIKHF